MNDQPSDSGDFRQSSQSNPQSTAPDLEFETTVLGRQHAEIQDFSWADRLPMTEISSNSNIFQPLGGRTNTLNPASPSARRQLDGITISGEAGQHLFEQLVSHTLNKDSILLMRKIF